MPVHSVSPVDIDTVGQSWTQTNAERYGFTQAPVALCLDRRSGRSTTTYEIPNLDNAVHKQNSLRDWEPGQALPIEQTLGSLPVSTTPRGVTTPIISRPMDRPMGHVFRDLELNIVPIILSKLYGGIENEVDALLGTAGNWTSTVGVGAAARFTDGAGAFSANQLDEFNADISQPDQDINVELQRFRKFQGISGLSLECWTNSHVLDTLARHPSYSGSGAGSAIASMLARDEFLGRFQAAHRLDRVVLLDSVGDTVRAGIASVLNYTANGLLWFGLVDRRGEMDIRTEGSLDAPDGAIYLAQARAPEVASWATPGMETESFAGRASFEVISPRGTAFGVTWTQTGAGGIFNALPA